MMPMKNPTVKAAVVSIAIVILVTILSFFAASSRRAIVDDTAPLSIEVGAGTVDLHLSVAPQTTLYDDLVLASKAGLVSFSGKKYDSLGFFVTDIGSLHQGGGKFLMFDINGTASTVGVSTYVPKDHDRIIWNLQ